MRFIESDDTLSLRGAQLMEAIALDKKQNLIPFFVSTSIYYHIGEIDSSTATYIHRTVIILLL